jgi:hypothetical protein
MEKTEEELKRECFESLGCCDPDTFEHFLRCKELLERKERQRDFLTIGDIMRKQEIIVRCYQ